MLLRLTAPLLRCLGWWTFSAALLIAVLHLAPQQAGIIVYKTLLVAFAVALSYIASKSLFRNAPPITLDMPRDVMSAASLVARAIVAHAIISGLTGGL